MSRKITIIDSVDKKPLEAANITLLDKNKVPLPGGSVIPGPDVVQTDAAGEVYLPTNPLIEYVKVTYVGYQDKIVEAKDSTVALESKSFAFGTAKVTACRQYNTKNESGDCEFSWKEFFMDHKMVVVFVVIVFAIVAFLLSHKF